MAKKEPIYHVYGGSPPPGTPMIGRTKDEILTSIAEMEELYSTPRTPTLEKIAEATYGSKPRPTATTFEEIAREVYEKKRPKPAPHQEDDGDHVIRPF